MRVPRQLLRDAATVEAYGGSGALGPLYAAETEIRISIQPTTRVVSAPDGEALTIDTMAIIRPEDGPLRPESRVTARGIRYRVVECYPMPDERRPTHYELSLAKFQSPS